MKKERFFESANVQAEVKEGHDFSEVEFLQTYWSDLICRHFGFMYDKDNNFLGDFSLVDSDAGEKELLDFLRKARKSKDYQDKKAQALSDIIEAAYDFYEDSVSWGECAAFTDWVYNKAKRFGLIRELKEEGLL